MTEIILDSNIVIYAVQPAFGQLRDSLRATIVSLPSVVLVEVLGFHRITPEEDGRLRRFVSGCKVIPLDDDTIQRAISLRRTRNMQLGDSIIAATALVTGRTLWTNNLGTNNLADFAGIEQLDTFNPLA
jgi:predicted nucleic acid-binding protein